MSYSSGAEGPATLQDEQATAGGGGTWAATVYLLLLGGIMMVATAPVGWCWPTGGVTGHRHG